MLIKLGDLEMEDHSHRYHFDLRKDYGWIWLAALPFGLVCWVIPFVLAFGLTGTGMEKGTAAVIAFLFLGVPAYLVGWIFIYSFMETIVTCVTFSDDTIYHRTPLMIFPLFWKTKKIALSEIENINFFAPYGTRTAILLFLHHGNKTRKYFLPRFKDQPDYLDEFKAFSKGMDGNQFNEKIGVKETVKEQMLADGSSRHSNLRFWNSILNIFNGFLIFILILGCGLFCLQLPVPAYQAFSAGASVGMVLVLLCLVISIPVLGQGLIWFFGRTVIVWSFGFLKINSDSLLMPSVLQRFFNQWLKWGGGNISLTDFAFWCFFLLSILYSVDRLVRHFNRKR